MLIITLKKKRCLKKKGPYLRSESSFVSELYEGAVVGSWLSWVSRLIKNQTRRRTCVH